MKRISFGNIAIQINRLLNCEEGLAFLEFALAFPILFILFVGGSEIARELIIAQKLENMTTSVADATAQIDTRNLPVANFVRTAGNTPGYMDTVFSATVGMIGGYGNSEVFVSDYSRPIVAGVPQNVQRNWYCITRVTYRGIHNTSQSRLQVDPNGTSVDYLNENGTTVINTLVLNPGDEVIIAEGFYHYSPVINNEMFPTFILYSTSSYPLRFSSTLANYMAPPPLTRAGTYGRCTSP